MIKTIALATALFLPATAHAYTEWTCFDNGYCVEINSIYCDNGLCSYTAQYNGATGLVLVECHRRLYTSCLSNGQCYPVTIFQNGSVAEAVCNGFSK